MPPVCDEFSKPTKWPNKRAWPFKSDFNAATNEYVDLIKAGVMDPAKVTCAALQNAASVATLLLTTEALISVVPEKKKGGEGGGDMGDMGGMDF